MLFSTQRIAIPRDIVMMMMRLMDQWSESWHARWRGPSEAPLDLLSKFVVNNNSDHEPMIKLIIDILKEMEHMHSWESWLHRLEVPGSWAQLSLGMQPRKVLSIVGPGATALAEDLYHRNKGLFVCSAQVNLSMYADDMKTALKEMLRQVTNRVDDYDALNETKLIRRIYQALRFKRYLVVVLDIWKESDWTNIAGAFPMGYNSCSSRVITTTRRNKVAEICCSGILDLVYKLECPRPKDEDATARRESVEIQHEVADASADLFVGRSGGCDWERCTLYLSTLPDHHEFERESLVRKWLAAKLVAEKGVANLYFDELVNRNVVLQHLNGRHYYKFGEEPRYHVRPTILGILRKMLQKKGFAEFISNGTASSASPADTPVQPFCAVLREEPAAAAAPLPEEVAAATAESATSDAPLDLRSAISVTARGCVQGVVLALRHLEKHEVLVVLDLEGCEGVEDKDVVRICCYLTLLRYLSLKGTPVTEIPADVEKLTCLETLDVRETRVQQLPEEVARLSKLERLLFSGGVKPLGLGQGASSTSSIKVLGDVHQSELQRCLYYAKEVRELVVVCDGGEDLPAPSSVLHLEKLKVVGRCVKLPACIKEAWLRKVTVLEIRMCQLNDDDQGGDLEALGRMASLRSLALSLVSLPTKQIDIRSSSSGGGGDDDKEPLFQRLEVFALDCRVPWVSFHEKAMPKLHSLYLKLYASADLKIPSGTIHLASLREVTLHFSPHYASSASVTHTVAAVEEELAHHTGIVPVALFVDKKHKIPKIQAPGDIFILFLHWCMRNFLECVFMPNIYLAWWCFHRAGHAVKKFLAFYVLSFYLLLAALQLLLIYFLLPKITNMVAHEIARRAFTSPGAMALPLPLVFYALMGNFKWLPVIYFSIFVLLDVGSYNLFTLGFLPMLLFFLFVRYMYYVEMGKEVIPVVFLISIISIITFIFFMVSDEYQVPELYTVIWKFFSSRVARLIIRLPCY